MTNKIICPVCKTEGYGYPEFLPFDNYEITDKPEHDGKIVICNKCNILFKVNKR